MSAVAGSKKSTKYSLLLFVVEGKSDKQALEVPISCFLDEHGLENVQVDFCVCNGDRIPPDALLKKLDEIVDKHLNDSTNYYTFADVSAIIYVCDTDGTYIPAEDCHQCDKDQLPMGADGREKLLYEKDGIYGTDADQIVARNRHKKENMDKLLSSHYRTKTVGHGAAAKKHTVKRQVYYFSANLDHFLHDDQNLYCGNKVGWAVEFSRDPNKAIRRLRKHSTCVTAQELAYAGLLPLHADYDAKRLYDLSWKYIKSGLNSVKRHTNLNLLLDALEKEGMDIFDCT